MSIRFTIYYIHFTIYPEFDQISLFYPKCRGLATQLVRQIPNTAIMMSIYEAVVYILTRQFNNEFYDAT